MRIPAHIKYVVISILFILAAINFTRTTLEILKSSKRLDDLKVEVTQLEEHKNSLEDDIQYKNSDEYVEERARNDLNLVKPGEKVYVVENLDLKVSDNKKDDVLSSFSKKVEERSKSQGSYAYQWFELFFK
jgi:cell division protein FtsB